MCAKSSRPFGTHREFRRSKQCLAYGVRFLFVCVCVNVEEKKGGLKRKKRQEANGSGKDSGGKREEGAEQMSQGYVPEGLCPQQYKLLLSRNAYCIRTASSTDKEF